MWHEGLGLWLAARHADADAVLRNRRLGRIFTPREPLELWDTFNWLHADSILDSEPPKHTRLKSLVAKAFARGHVERLRPRVRALASGLLDDVDPGGFDLIAAYAEPLPVMVVGELLGVPLDEQAAAATVVAGDREDVRVRPDGRAGGRRPGGRARSSRRSSSPSPTGVERRPATTWSRTSCRSRNKASG